MSREASVLRVPTSPSYARAVRMFAANIAVVGEFSVDEVEDLRMAAEEGFVYACATEPSEVEVSFALEGGQVEVEYSLGNVPPDETDPALAYATLLLEAVCDSFELDQASHVLRLTKAGVA